MNRRFFVRTTVVISLVSGILLSSSCSILKNNQDMIAVLKALAIDDLNAQEIDNSEFESLLNCWNSNLESELNSYEDYVNASNSIIIHDDIVKTILCRSDFDTFFEDYPNGIYTEIDVADDFNSRDSIDIVLNDYVRIGVFASYNSGMDETSNFDETFVTVYELSSEEEAKEDFVYYIECIEDLYNLRADDFNIKEYKFDENEGYFIYHFESDLSTDAMIDSMQISPESFHYDEAVYWQGNNVIVIQGVGFDENNVNSIASELGLKTPNSVQNSASVQNSHYLMAEAILLRLCQDDYMARLTYIPSPTSVELGEEEGQPVSLDDIRDDSQSTETIPPEVTDAPVNNNPLIGTTITFGTYEQSGETSGPEPIEWVVLDVNDEGEMLIISSTVLESLPYSDSTRDWPSCSLRSWLNNDFYNTSFSAGEQARIIATEIYSGDSDSESSQELVTTDNVFILSIDEASRYLDPDGNGYVDDCGVTSTLSWTRNSSEIDGWWLRSAGSGTSFVSVVSNNMNGYINSHGLLESANYGVRPVMWIAPE